MDVKKCFNVILVAQRALNTHKPLLLVAWAARPPTTMQASSVSSSQTRVTRGTSALLALLLAGAALTGFSNSARADDGRVVSSTGIGAIAGAIIGQSIGGRNATIVGGALGAAIGASAATEGGNYYRNGPSSGSYQGGYYQGGQGGYNAYPPVQARVVVSPPVQYYRPAPVIYQPVYQPVYRGYYQPNVRPVVYPIYNRGGRDERHDRYDSDDRRGNDGRGWDRGGNGHDGRRDGDRRR